MTRLFVQIYVAIVIAMGVVSWMMVNLTRSNNKFVSEEIRVSTEWLTARISATAMDSPERRRVVAELHQLVGPHLAIIPLDALELPDDEMARLTRGEMAASRTRHSHYVYRHLPGEDRAVEWQIHNRANPLALVMGLYTAIDAVPSTDKMSAGQPQQRLGALERARLRWRPITVAEGLNEQVTYRLTDDDGQMTRFAVAAGVNLSIDWIAPLCAKWRH
ncbi:MAG: hypothetical protein AAGC55_22770, partial [Myxococcota bacterium]